jgi:hypothetical protein
MRCCFLAPILVLAIAAVAVADAPKVTPSYTAQPVMISSNGDYMPRASGCSSCSNATFGNKLKARPEEECRGCSTLHCACVFALGSCRAFFGEGRFHSVDPALPIYP